MTTPVRHHNTYGKPEEMPVTENVWKIPEEQFASLWNTENTLNEVAESVKRAVEGPAPRWAVMARAGQMRNAGVAMKELLPANFVATKAEKDQS